MATKKPVAKKTPKATTPKAKATAKKPAAKKPAARATAKKPATRRPDPNLPPSADTINQMTNDVLYIIGQLDDYTANLRALDRMRHNGVGLKRQGFIEAAFRH